MKPLWIIVIAALAGLMILISPGVLADSFCMSTDQSFIEDVSSRVSFPVMPLGGCYDGTRVVSRYYGGMQIVYAMDPGDDSWRGHVWLLVEDSQGSWLAIDSYYGPVNSPEFYDPPIVVEEFGELDVYIPRIPV